MISRPGARDARRPTPPGGAKGIVLASAALLATLASCLPASAQQGDLAELERRAEALYEADRLEDAVAAYLELAELHSDPEQRARLLVLAAWLQQTAGRHDLSRATLWQALAANPDHRLQEELFNQSFVETFEELRQQQAAQLEEELDSQLQRALDLLRRQETAPARALLERIVERFPSDRRAPLFLARLEAASGEERAALERLEGLIDRIESDPQASEELLAGAYAQLGVTRYRLDLLPGAAAAFHSALTLAPDQIESWYNLGLVELAREDFEAAATAFYRARELDPDNRHVLRNLSASLSALARWQELLALAASIREMRPPDPRSLLDLAVAELNGDRLEEAERDLREVLELDSDNEAGAAHLSAARLAALLLRQGRLTEAEAEARRALAWRPDLIDGLQVSGLIALEARRPADALAAFERLVTSSPEEAAAHNNLGNALFALGRFAEARAAFSRALELDPDLLAARRNLERLAAAETAVDDDPPETPEETSPEEPVQREAEGERRPSGPLPLGVRFEDRRDLLTGRLGAAVVELDPGGLGARSGLEVGDLVLRAGGSSLSGASDLQRQLEALTSASSLRLDILRGETALAITFRRP